MVKLTFEYQGHGKLQFHEWSAIIDYYNGDKEPVARLIEDKSENLSVGMRKFIADVTRGQVKRKRGQRLSKFKRDFEIYQEVSCLKFNGYNLTSGREDGAASIVAQQFMMEEDAVIKAYQKIKKKQEEHDAIK